MLWAFLLYFIGALDAYFIHNAINTAKDLNWFVKVFAWPLEALANILLNLIE